MDGEGTAKGAFQNGTSGISLDKFARFETAHLAMFIFYLHKIE